MEKYEQFTKEINGKKYTAQFNGLAFALDTVDKSYIDGSNNVSVKKLAEQIFKYIIVDPANLTPDDFSDIDEMNQVIKFGRDVMQGIFRTEEEIPHTVKARSEE